MVLHRDPQRTVAQTRIVAQPLLRGAGDLRVSGMAAGVAAVVAALGAIVRLAARLGPRRQGSRGTEQSGTSWLIWTNGALTPLRRSRPGIPDGPDAGGICAKATGMAMQIASPRPRAPIRRAGHARLCDNPGQPFPTATAPCAFFASTNMKRLLSGLSLLVVALLSGCGVAAAPCRVASAGLKMVPLVGHVAAAPTDACADIID